MRSWYQQPTQSCEAASRQYIFCRVFSPYASGSADVDDGFLGSAHKRMRPTANAQVPSATMKSGIKPLLEHC